MMKKYRVGILGATGTVGQRFVQLLDGHPQFEITALAASDRSIFKPFAEACNWKLSTPMPEGVKDLPVKPIDPDLDCDLVFSSLPSNIARETEESFAGAGYPVVSNSSAFRMHVDVPLVIPEINSDHLRLIEVQKEIWGFEKGFIVTNPNCSVIAFAPPLAAIDEAFGVSAVIVTTMQAVSGAGYPGVASLDIVDNVLPHIDGEEPKVESEAQKILGQFADGGIRKADFAVSAQCNRVPVNDGHLACVQVKLRNPASIRDVRQAMEDYPSLDLHSSPKQLIIVRDELDRPQPKLDRDAEDGMAITVGRLMPSEVLDYRFVALSHNTIRGAAGAAILNAELLVSKKMIKGNWDSTLRECEQIAI